MRGTRKRCPLCGSNHVEVSSPRTYHYENCGLPNVGLTGEGAVAVFDCPDCRNVVTVIPQEQQLLQVIGLGLLCRAPGMTGAELRFLRTLFGMTQTEFASALGMPRRGTVSDWESRKRVFESPQQEIGYRLLLTDLYRKRVIETGHSFLSDDHKSRFDDLFTKFAERMLESLTETSNGHIGITRRPRKKVWEPELIGA